MIRPGPRRWRLAVLAGLLALAACEPAPDVYGDWRAVLTVPGGDLPFGLEIRRDGDGDVAWLVNGVERVRVDDVRIDGTQVEMQMPGYPHRLSAALEDGRLVGHIAFMRPGGRTTEVRLVAQRDQPWRFFPPGGEEPADFSGRWAVTFTSPDTGARRAAVAEFTQRGREVTGTVLRSTGDDRYLAGEVRGNMLMLSRFDGGSAFLYVARLDHSGRLSGEFRSGSWGHQRFEGVRDASAALAADAAQTALAPGAERLEFSFPDIDGQPVSLSDPRFAGKIVIVTIGGSWCPNCHDEAVFLRDFLPGRRERGLEVVQLMFEYTDDAEEARRLVREFASRYDIDYPVLLAGTYGNVSDAIPAIANFHAYPTMLVLGRDGRILHTHTGFSGPATGEHYDRFVADFTALIDGLLAEQG